MLDRFKYGRSFLRRLRDLQSPCVRKYGACVDVASPVRGHAAKVSPLW